MIKIIYRKIFFLYVCLFLTMAIAGCATTYNPATGRKEMILISTSQELNWGQQFHQSLLNEEDISKDGEMTKRIIAIGQSLARVSDRKDYEYKFYLIEKDELNAFTTPGGNIYVYTGLVKKLKTDDQIAGVLAHEIGHCAAKHTVKKFQKALGYNLVGALVLSQVAEESQQLAGMGANAIMSVVFSAYSRQDEYEADRLAVKYTYLAGYDPNGVVESFQMLDQESKGPDVPEFLRSHPYMKDRVTMAQQQVKNAEKNYGHLK